MGLLDKAKAMAGQAATQAKELAGEAAEKAKQEAKELQLKRELGQVHEELGRTTFDLVESGALTHPELGPTVERIRALRAQLSELQAG
jgi:hypothetical protein